MKASAFVSGTLLALSASGCLATKGDIRLVQDELRAVRASAARADSAHRRTSDSLAAAVIALADAQTRATQALAQSQLKTSDDLKALATRQANSEITTNEQLRTIGTDLDQVRELSRQNARGVSAARAAVDQSRPAATQPVDSGATPINPVPARTPSAAVLFASGRSQINNGSCTTARRSFQDILTNYPQSDEAAEAQWWIAESYLACGEPNNAKADSIYQVVVAKYPKTDFAAISLYKRAEMLRNANKPAEARPLYTRVVCEYRTSTVYDLALNRLGGTRPATCR